RPPEASRPRPSFRRPSATGRLRAAGAGRRRSASRPTKPGAQNAPFVPQKDGSVPRLTGVRCRKFKGQVSRMTAHSCLPVVRFIFKKEGSMRHRFRLVGWGLIVVGLFLAKSAAAQFGEAYGGLYGRVVDETGAALPGVTVTLKGPGAPFTQTTNQ